MASYSPSPQLPRSPLPRGARCKLHRHAEPDRRLLSLRHRQHHLAELARPIVDKGIIDNHCTDALHDTVELHPRYAVCRDAGAFARADLGGFPSSTKARTRRLLSSIMVSNVTGAIVLTSCPGVT